MSLTEYDKWSSAYSQNAMAFPAEYVIRIFKGKYPNLDFDKAKYRKQRILDVGAGDGRNAFMLHGCGFSCAAVEVTDEICSRMRQNFANLHICDIDVRTGNNEAIPFGNAEFDYLLSWNACYYMGNTFNFPGHVQEYARVLKEDGTLVMSIPKHDCFIYKGSELKLINGANYALITQDPFNIRNGELLRIFADEQEIEDAFSSHFTEFIFGSVEDDCFGFDYRWHLVVATRKG